MFWTLILTRMHPAMNCFVIASQQNFQTTFTRHLHNRTIRYRMCICISEFLQCYIKKFINLTIWTAMDCIKTAIINVHHTATHLVEMLSNNLPYPRPLQADTSHVVVRNLNNLLQTEHPCMRRVWQLLHWYHTQCPDELHYTADSQAVKMFSLQY